MPHWRDSGCVDQMGKASRLRISPQKPPEPLLGPNCQPKWTKQARQRASLHRCPRNQVNSSVHPPLGPHPSAERKQPISNTRPEGFAKVWWWAPFTSILYLGRVMRWPHRRQRMTASGSADSSAASAAASAAASSRTSTSPSEVPLPSSDGFSRRHTGVRSHSGASASVVTLANRDVSGRIDSCHLGEAKRVAISNGCLRDP